MQKSLLSKITAAARIIDYESVVRAVKASDVRTMARHISAGSAFIQVYTEE